MSLPPTLQCSTPSTRTRPTRTLAALCAALLLALPGCDWGGDNPDAGSSGDDIVRLFCNVTGSTFGSLQYLGDRVRDCAFDYADSVDPWETLPDDTAGQNEVTAEFDEARSRVAPGLSGSVQVSNLKRNLTTGFGAIAQCFPVQAAVYYSASGSIFVPAQQSLGVPPRFQSYLQITFYEYDDCFGTALGSPLLSQTVTYPQMAERWRDVSTGQIEAPDGAVSARIDAVVDVVSGNPVGQSYIVNFDEVSFSESVPVVVPTAP